MKITISVVICTHNGGRTLRKCLEALDHQIFNNNRLEILVIDNASTDNTKSIVSDFKITSRFKCNYYYETKLGLSYARNRGIAESTGKYIAFIDDDAMASSLWATSICKGFFNDKIGCLGGKVELQLLSTRPRWLTDDLLGYLAIFDKGCKRRILTYDEHPVGCNIAFRKSVLLSVSGFRTKFGDEEQALRYCDETELCQRVHRITQILYEPDALVIHLIPRERLQLKAFFARYYFEGKYRLIIAQNADYSWGRICKLFLEIIYLLSRFIYSRQIVHLFYASYCLGNMKEIFRKMNYRTT